MDMNYVFLDLKLTLKDNEIQTEVYIKATDSHLYLQAGSCHHLPSSILGIKNRFTLRLRRICSTSKKLEGVISKSGYL